jgi:hypothetical protein
VLPPQQPHLRCNLTIEQVRHPLLQQGLCSTPLHKRRAPAVARQKESQVRHPVAPRKQPHLGTVMSDPPVRKPLILSEPAKPSASFVHCIVTPPHPSSPLLFQSFVRPNCSHVRKSSSPPDSCLSFSRSLCMGHPRMRPPNNASWPQPSPSHCHRTPPLRERESLPPFWSPCMCSLVAWSLSPAIQLAFLRLDCLPSHQAAYSGPAP